MADDPSAERFAIVRTSDESAVDNPGIARLLAEPLEMAVVDLIQVLPQRSGILAENLPQHVADRCIAILNASGVRSQAVPQTGVVEPPEVITLRSGRPDDEVFFYVAATQKGVIRWADVIWVDFVSIQELSKEEFDDWELAGGDEGQQIHRFKAQRIVTKRPLFIDVVSYEPWLVLRIPQERFEFAATGLPIFPSRRENLIALAAAMATKAESAELGPGLAWLAAKSPPQEHRFANQALYRGYLRWKLTQRYLE